MGDKHVCSLCNEKLEGEQHIKIVFENWPIEETVTYRRKGKERTTTRKLTKEVITALGMECLRNPERWKGYDIDPSKVEEFFEDLRFAGKNPIFNAVLTKSGPICLSPDCKHRTGTDCQHLLRFHSQSTGLDELACEVGHPGKILVRKGRERVGLFSPLAYFPNPRGQARWWKFIGEFVTFSWGSQHSLLTKIYFAVTYSLPMLAFLSLYMLVAYPFWGLLCLKGRLQLLLGGLK